MKNILQGGLAANYSEASVEELNKEYGMYLMDEETITMGFKLVRDALIFTDKRIIMTDKQGATDTKMSVKSITTPELKGHHIEYASHKLEFPKKYNVQSLYKILQELAYENCLKINNLN